MTNMEIYNKVRNVPDTAKKTINAGRIKGMTDINPMWRIQTLTEQFGMCGIGWKYEITEKSIKEGADGCMCAFVDINLYVRDAKTGGPWSDAIPGTGGSQFVSVERNGKYTNDECFKMALTDALSVACKALGVGADVYWSAGRTKYDRSEPETEPMATDAEKKQFMAMCKNLDVDYRDIIKQAGVTGQMSRDQYAKCLVILRDIEDSKK